MKDINLLSSNGVDIKKGLELLGDMEMYDETLEDFIVESENRNPKLEEYKKKDDMENYAILVHGLKSDSQYLGFTKLAELSLQHELESKNNNKKFIDENYEALILELNKILTLINQYLGN